MGRLETILLLLGITLFGAARLRTRYNRYGDRKLRADDFLRVLHKYLESRGGDLEAYTWLTKNAPVVQEMLGRFGRADYQPTSENYVIHNYQVIVNTLPQLRILFATPLSSSRWAENAAATLQEALLRYIGAAEEQRKHVRRALLNPLICFREGIQLLLSAPFLMLSWLGLGSSESFTSMAGRLAFKVITATVSVVALASGLVTIVIGWDQFIERITQIVAKLSSGR